MTNAASVEVFPDPKRLGQQLRYADRRGIQIAIIIGVTTIAMLRLSGVTRLWSVEPLAHRRNLALAMGADAAIDPGTADPVAEILKDTAKRGVDIAIDCAANGESTNQCLRVARNCGRVVMTGIPSEVQIHLDFSFMRRKELAFYTVRRSNHDSEAALNLLATYPQRFAPLLTHERPLQEVQKAFELCSNYADGIGKMTLTL